MVGVGPTRTAKGEGRRGFGTGCLLARVTRLGRSIRLSTENWRLSGSVFPHSCFSCLTQIVYNGICCG